jgi:anti-anti-sigma regulatory factor
VGREVALAHADELQSLVVEAYARGREDRARTDAQRGLAEALPVAEVAPHVVVILAAGALDPDGASALADRASSYLLRRDAKAALLDIAGLVSPTAAVLAELWSIPSAARMLGVRMVVSGVSGYVGEAVRAANLHDEGESRVTTMAEGVEALLRAAGIALGGSRGFGSWLRGLLTRT